MDKAREVEVKKEALFNEVKGSLFEFLVAKELSKLSGSELLFLRTLPEPYLHLLSQQDRMVRQFYPEMISFLTFASRQAAQKLREYLVEIPPTIELVGKFSRTLENSLPSGERFEGDIILGNKEEKGCQYLSLKLNKKGAFVNTKSGGIKSFFNQYFPFIKSEEQLNLNQFVDLEFNRMAFELHAQRDMDYTGNFQNWIQRGFSEFPGELDHTSRDILRKYYSRIAKKIYDVFFHYLQEQKFELISSLPPLLGFGSSQILQLIYFHEFPDQQKNQIHIHHYQDMKKELQEVELLEFHETASVEFRVGKWILQIRIKPMNKFTTTALKINCSVKTHHATFAHG